MESDSAGEKQVPVASAGLVVLNRSAGSRGISYTLAPGNEGSVVRNKIRVSALVAGQRVIVDPAPYAAVPCSPATAQLHSDIADLALPIGGGVSLGHEWTDSLALDVCVGGIPGQAQQWRRFDAVGDTTVGQEPAAVVVRSDSLAADASGTLDQHILSLTLAGRSLARIYVSVESGKILLITKTQVLNIAVVSAGRTKNFVQKTTSITELSR